MSICHSWVVNYHPSYPDKFNSNREHNGGKAQTLFMSNTQEVKISCLKSIKQETVHRQQCLWEIICFSIFIIHHVKVHQWNTGNGLKPQPCSKKSVFFCELDPKTPTLLLSFCLDVSSQPNNNNRYWNLHSANRRLVHIQQISAPRKLVVSKKKKKKTGKSFLSKLYHLVAILGTPLASEASLLQ